MPGFPRVLVAVLWLAVGSRAAAAVQLSMTVEGPRGPFATTDYARPSALALTGVQLDFGPAGAGPLVAPPPVLVTRAIDALSRQFLGAAASQDVLRVIITVTQTPSAPPTPDAPAPPGGPARQDGPRRRRVVTLTNARVLSVHAGMAASDGDVGGLGVETIAFTYERIDVVDDGAKVFTSGG